MSQTFQPISFHFIPTKDDYIRGLRAFETSKTNFKRNMAKIGIFEALFVVAIFAGSLGDGPWPWLLVLIGPIILGYFWGILPLRMGRQIEKNERFTAETTWELGEDQIVIKNKFSETKMDWGSFQKVVETGDYYLLIYATSKNMFQFIPKRAFESQEQETNFRELLKRKLG